MEIKESVPKTDECEVKVKWFKKLDEYQKKNELKPLYKPSECFIKVFKKINFLLLNLLFKFTNVK